MWVWSKQINVPEIMCKCYFRAIKKNQYQGAVLRWQRNRMERRLSPPTNSLKDHLKAEQIPQNNFWMLAEDTRHPERQPILFKRSAVWMEKSWGYCKNKTASQRQEVLNPKLGNIRKILTPGNINQQKLIQKPPYLQWNQAPPKSQQGSK